MRQILIFLSFFIFSYGIEKDGFGKNYYDLSIQEKRKVFFEKMSYMLDKACLNVKKEREFALAFLNESYKNAYRINDFKLLEKLVYIKNKYKIENLFDKREYEIKIACVPKSMAIAQALIESATATSRFAKEANNLFGEWTWGEKGLVPNDRAKDKTHKIRIFDTLQDSVDSYVLNLNRNFAYKNFRNQRYIYLKNNKNISGLDAVKNLHAYSELKDDYTNLVIKIMKQYDLSKYD